MGRWVKVATVAQVPPGTVRRVEVDGEPIALCNVGGTFYAIYDICSHAEASLSEGELVDMAIECPLHGSQFDLRTGRPLSLPATQPVPVYRVRVEGGDVLVEVGDP
jgi:3-phenylpropionate/trans-cinnamate dioxygenase ferredoxin subunit